MRPFKHNVIPNKSIRITILGFILTSDKIHWKIKTITIYVGHLESKEHLRIQPAQLFHFS